MSVRERGRIAWVESVTGGDAWANASIGVALADGTSQAFGYGLPALNKDPARATSVRSQWFVELCDTFDVTGRLHLIGAECHVLRETPYFNDPIVGMESVRTGRRFVAIEFLRRHGLDPYPNISRLEVRKGRIQESIASQANQPKRLRQKLQTLEEVFVDWSQQ